MDVVNIKKSAISGMIWQLISRIGSNGLQFLTYLILARLLQPHDFGIIAIVGVFINFSNLLINSGFGTAIIQANEIDDIDYSSVLYVSVILASIFYAIIYLIAPFIAEYYHQNAIILVLRIYSISLIFFAINGVQSSILYRKLQFKRISILTLIPVFISGIISVVLAFKGFGVYALVANSISNSLLSVILFAYILKWKPKREFSISRIKIFFSLAII